MKLPTALNPFSWVRAYRLAQIVMRAHPFGELAFFRGLGKNKQPKPDQMKSDLEALGLDPFVYAAVGGIARSVSEAPLIAEQIKRENGEDKWIRDDSTALGQLIARPNPIEGMTELIWKAFLSELLNGNAYWVLSDALDEIWHVRSDWVTVAIDEDGYPESYEIKNARGQTKLLNPSQVIHFRLPAVIDPSYGMSPVKPIRGAILTNYFFGQYVEQFFEEGAVPGGLITSEQTINHKRRDEAREEWNRIHKGPGKGRGHEVAFLGAGYSYQTISPPLKDLVVEVVQRIARERIIAVYGTPPIIVGDWQRATLNNADKMMRLWWQSSLLPKMRLFSQTIERKLIPLLGESNPRSGRQRIRFWTEDVMALQEDKGEQADRSVRLYQGGVAQLNEAREMAGLAKIDDGDVFYQPAAGVMISPQSEKSLLVGERAPQLTTGRRLRLPASGQTRSDDDADYQIWTNLVSRAVRIERDLKRDVQAFFDDQLERVIDRLYTLSGEGKSTSALWLRINTRDDGILPPNIDDVFDLGDENRRLAEKFGPLFFELFDTAGNESLEEFGFGIQFDVSAPRAEAFIEGMVNKMKDVNDYTWSQLKDVLATAETEGWSLKQTVDQLKTWPELFDDVRATRVVRTEGTTLANGSAWTAWGQAGVQGKRWIASMDEATRLSHVRANNQIVAIDAQFQLDGGRADYPGDYRLPARERINCRCAMGPVDELPVNEED